MPLSPLIASFSRKLLEDYTSPPPVTNDNSYNYNINPRFSTVLAVASFALVGVFFCACFCSIYLRRCSSNLDNIDQPASTHRHYRAGLGVEPDLVQTFPLVIYSVDAKESSPTNYDSECVVCLSEFEEGETLRLLPECKHGFHRDCIDMWLFSHTTCPLCRSSVLNKASADSVVPIEPRIPTIGERMNEEAEDLTATLLHQADNTATQSDQQRCDLGVDNNQLRRSHSTGQLIISTQSDRLADTVCGKNTEAASSRPQRVSSMDRVCYRVQEEGTSKKKTAAAANSTSLWRSAGMSLSRSFRLPKLSSSSSFSAQTSESVTSAV